MAVHPQFPASPYAPLIPEHRWFPAAEELRGGYEKLLPPLVARIRQGVQAWRDSGYSGASDTSRTEPSALLFGEVPRRLLGLLLMQPDQGFHVREIARLTGADAGNAQLETRGAA